VPLPFRLFPTGGNFRAHDVLFSGVTRDPVMGSRHFRPHRPRACGEIRRKSRSVRTTKRRRRKEATAAPGPSAAAGASSCGRDNQGLAAVGGDANGNAASAVRLARGPRDIPNWRFRGRAFLPRETADPPAARRWRSASQLGLPPLEQRSRHCAAGPGCRLSCAGAPPGGPGSGSNRLPARPDRWRQSRSSGSCAPARQFPSCRRVR